MANTQIPSSAIFQPRRNNFNASTLGSTIEAGNGIPSIRVSSSSGAYIDVNNIDASKLVIMYGTTDTGNAAFVVRTDNNPFTGKNVGQSLGEDAVGTRDTEVLRGIKLSCYSGLTYPAGGYYVAGPFETHMVKDTNNRINFDGTTDQSSVMEVFITPILLP